MKKFAGSLLCALIVLFSVLSLSGCENNNGASGGISETVSTASTSAVSLSETETELQTTEAEPSETALTEPTEQITASTDQTTVQSETAAPPETTARTEKTIVTETSAEKLSVEKDGSYTTPEDVAEYIHTFGTLPNNFITKSEAKELGWDNKKGNLWDVAEGKSIGGDRFGNYEKLLPEKKGRKYTECDVNYEGGYRGSERIIFSNDGLIYYTNDHYQTFTQLY